MSIACLCDFRATTSKWYLNESKESLTIQILDFAD